MKSLDGPVYKADEPWAAMVARRSKGDVVDVAVDSNDRVFVLARDLAEIIIFDAAGNLVGAFGHGVLSNAAHGLTIDADDAVYCVDEGANAIRKFSPEGEQLRCFQTTWSDSGADWSLATFNDRIASVRRGAQPLNRPTAVAATATGDLYVTDGYGNSRVHQFTADFQLTRSWGEPGSGPGQFRIPHGIGVTDDGRVLVADRENERIQVFTYDGRFLSEWIDVQRPTSIAIRQDGLVLVSEMGWSQGSHSWRRGTINQAEYSRISIFDLDGNVLGRLGGADSGCGGSAIAAAHGLAIDAHGSLYVAETTFSFTRGSRSPVANSEIQGVRDSDAANCLTVKRFVRSRPD